MIETCANCGKTIDWGSLFRKIKGKKRVCHYCKEDFDVEAFIEKDGTLHLGVLIRNPKAKRG